MLYRSKKLIWASIAVVLLTVFNVSEQNGYTILNSSSASFNPIRELFYVSSPVSSPHKLPDTVLMKVKEPVKSIVRLTGCVSMQNRISVLNINKYLIVLFIILAVVCLLYIIKYIYFRSGRL